MSNTTINAVARSKALIALVLSGIALGGVVAWQVRRTVAPAPRATTPITHEAYIWQRSWDKATKGAVAGRTARFERVVVLAAELTIRRDEVAVGKAQVDYHLLKQTGRPIGVALRIGPYSGPFGADSRVFARIVEVSRDILDRARTAGLDLAEFQIDFDCPDSKLPGYAAWVSQLKRQLPGQKITITALPSWLAKPGCEQLLAAADGYILQVHSLQRPTSADSIGPLCDTAAARAAVERAARLGRPFRVALPTYSYLVAFNQNGKFAGLSAEGPRPSWPDSYRVVLHQADSTAIAALVREWTISRPAAMQGIIWYRLPTEDDTMNWSWAALQGVMAGRPPKADLAVVVEKPQSKLAEIVLTNKGTDDAILDRDVLVRLDASFVLAADSVGGFTLHKDERLLRLTPAAKGQRLRPGQRRLIAWIRLSEDKEVNAHVERQGS